MAVIWGFYPSWVSVSAPAMHTRILRFSPILKCRCAQAYSSWIRSICDDLSLSYSGDFQRDLTQSSGWVTQRLFHIHCQKPFEWRLSCLIRVTVQGMNCVLELFFFLGRFSSRYYPSTPFTMNFLTAWHQLDSRFKMICHNAMQDCTMKLPLQFLNPHTLK